MKSLLATLLFTTLLFPLAAQVEIEDRTTPQRSYAAFSTFESEALANFDALFPNQNVGFFHVYADPNVDPKETYLLRGNEMGGAQLALLPKKLKRAADKIDAKVYAGAAIRGRTDNLYLIRMDGEDSDRIDLVGIKGGEVEHLRTLAYRDCQRGRCKQMDSFFTDIDGDAVLDLMTIKRKRNGREKRAVYVMDRNKNWKRTRELDAPWDSTEFHQD